MKKLIFLLLFLLFTCGFIRAESWDSNVIVALEMENNVTDTGNGGYEWTNNKSVPFSNTIFEVGLYSAGPFDASVDVAYGIQSNSAVTQAIKTVEFYFRPYNAGLSDRYLIYAGGWTVQYEGGGIRLLGGPIGASSFYSVSVGTWYHIAVTFDGTYIKMYVNGVFHAQLTSSYITTNAQWTVGNSGIFHVACNGYIDNVILSDVVRESFPTGPLAVETPTETVTETITETVTETVTETITETVTETITETVTETITETVTETITETVTETITETVTETITETVTETITETATETITETRTITKTITTTFTPTPTFTITRRPTKTRTPTITRTPTPYVKYRIPTRTRTPRFTPTATKTRYLRDYGTGRRTPTFTPTRTPTEIPWW